MKQQVKSVIQEREDAKRRIILLEETNANYGLQQPNQAQIQSALNQVQKELEQKGFQ